MTHARLRRILILGASLLALSTPVVCVAQASTVKAWGPYNAEFSASADSLKKDVRQGDLTGAAWTVSGWVKPSTTLNGDSTLVVVGDSLSLTTLDGRLGVFAPGLDLRSKAVLKPGVWTHVAMTSDGAIARLYVQGKKVAEHATTLGLPTSKTLLLAPRNKGKAAFAGRIAGLTVFEGTADAKALKAAAETAPKDDLIAFETGSATWPIQVRQMFGQVTPQDAWTLPQTRSGFTAPVAKPAYSGPGVVNGVIKSWFLMPAPQVHATGETLSKSGYDTRGWYAATTPGTVLTTLVDRGVYPDPDYGLNNLVIPESLNRQDYWYRAEFPVPADFKPGQHLFVTFKGVNYAAQIWVNGQPLGTMKGAFIRGQFDLSPYVQPGGNAVLAVRVSPPPHPGLAHEESLSAGPGDNGGAMAQDGPTFVASEGWDWIPSVRDRNSGLWQDVVLEATGDVRIGDAQVITDLKDDNRQADITLHVPVSNLSTAQVTTRIQAVISNGHDEPVLVARDVTLAPGDHTVSFTPQDFAVLTFAQPKLWWPNGYGEPALHSLSLKAFAGNNVSDSSELRFGIREVSYELSLVDPSGVLQRVEANFTRGHELGIRITDGSHKGIRRVAGQETSGGNWATSLRAEAVGTSAITPIADTALTPFLVIKVNGVRIAGRGGNWGMDDWRKRVSRDELEPFFRLHKEANVNIIRNWVGQNTQDSFFELADAYGMMVMNDFWASTQDYQLEPQDIPLFMANASDVVRRYRNHPSIIMWFGRNEGVPQPVLNEALEDLIYAEDGTRWYSGASNRVNLQNSGPYAHRPVESYFTTHARGFSVELGTASFPTREAFEAVTPVADRWPISDAWAYHDWHSASNGTTKPFEDALTRQFGAPVSLHDFERKAQMMNYDNHRAIFEGMNAGLWSAHSGRMLWMTQPAWPSTMWQIFSHDFDTHAAFYGTKSASEPVHVQMNLPDRMVIVVNNPTKPLRGVRVTADIHALDGTSVAASSQTVDVEGVAISAPLDFGISALLAQHKAVIIRLTLHDAAGAELSRNVYWQGAEEADLMALNAMAQVDLKTRAVRSDKGITLTVTNPGAIPALATKLTVLDADGQRVLPAYYSDNYISLMPGETRTVTVEGQNIATVAVRGWNIRETSMVVE